ncbi:MAG TPA: hypothetical protein VHG93_18655, partial [Longimicrobium sp.]|nr:hypothetical protein [Longimicrobium sp.]
MNTQRFEGTVQSGAGEQALPLTDLHVTLYEAGDGDPNILGVGNPNANGWFSFDYTAPEGGGTLYATAHMTIGVQLAAVIGAEVSGPVVINELTTVAAGYAFAQFIQSSMIRGNPFALGVAAGMCAHLADVRTGEPGAVMLAPPNRDQTNSLRSTRSLANFLAASVRDLPGARTDLQKLAPSSTGVPPVDTFQAVANIALNPARNVGEIYQQSQALQVYTPVLAAQPDAAWTLAVKVNRTGDDSYRMFGGPANIAWDANGYAWIPNNVFQGTPNGCDFAVVLKPNGMPSDGTNGTPNSPVIGAGLNGPGYGVAVGSDGTAWVGSFGWGPSSSFPTEGVVSKFHGDGSDGTPYYEGTERVQGMAIDADHNLWLTSYGNHGVTVYLGGVAQEFRVYPDANRPHETAPGNYTFGIAIDPTEPKTAWVTYSGGLGWPKANAGAVARFQIQGDRLVCLWSQALGAAVKGNAVDSYGNTWIASGGDSTVYFVTPGGDVSGFTNRGGVLGPWGVAVDGNDDVWVANFGIMGPAQVYSNAAISKLAGVNSPSGLAVGEALTPTNGYTLPTAGEPVTLPDGSPLYKDGTECLDPLMRMTSVTIDAAGNIWAVNNWKPRFGTDFEPNGGNPGGDGIVIFIGLAKP